MLVGPKFTARNRVVLAHEQHSRRGLGFGLVEVESHQRILALPDLRETFAQLGCRGGGPQGIFAIRPELPVPFAGEWAA